MGKSLLLSIYIYIPLLKRYGSVTCVTFVVDCFGVVLGWFQVAGRGVGWPPFQGRGSAMDWAVLVSNKTDLPLILACIPPGFEMDTWTPLFSSIVTSSIWGEPHHVRIVWVTMIALKDRNGFVEASVPGLARLAVVSMKECEDAIRRLSGPDQQSKTKTDEGRRIKPVPNGWFVLGHEHFQKKMQEVSRRVGNARRQAKHRAKKSQPEGTPLPGEDEYVQAEKNGASKDRLDSIVSKHLDSKS